MDFLITYEHKAREIESVVLLKALLERKGYSVMLFPWYNETRELYGIIKRDPPKVFVVSATYNEDNFRQFVTRVAGYIDKVINLRWEQVFTKKCEQLPVDWNLPAFYPSGIVKNVVHVCWGEEERCQLVNRGVSPNNAVVIGHLGMDYLRPEFKGFFYTKDELSKRYNLDVNKKWVLFISSFTYSKNDNETIEQRKKITGDPNDPFVSACVNGKREIIRWFDKVLGEVSDTIVIYRPHPNEFKDLSTLKSLADKYNNFRVIADLSVKQWIYNSDIIYNWYSTSFADIALLGKESVLLRPFPIDELYDYRVLSLQPKITCYEEFEESFKTGVIKSASSEAYKRLIHQYYDNDLTGIPAYKKAIELFEKVYNTDVFNLKYPLYYVFVSEFFFIFQKVKNIINYLISRSSLLRIVLFKKHYQKHMASMSAAKDRLKKGMSSNVATDFEIDQLYNKLNDILFSGK